MKKFLSLIALAISFGMTSCSDDDPTNGQDAASYSVIGSWYEESENEEMRFSENGTFYDSYSSYLICGESVGRWEYDGQNSKLTYSYPYMGQTQFADWTVKNHEELSFTIYSSQVANHNLEKIVESYEMNVNESVTIKFPSEYPSYSVTSYTSNNERIASVTPEGVITAEGEKGITYIKVSTTKGNAWVKVTVGENCADIWFDYVSLIGLDYNNVRSALNRLGEPTKGEDGYSYGFIQQIHSVIAATNIFICPEDGMTTEIQLVLRESAPESEILSYMNSRYYKQSETSSAIYYSSVKSQEESKAMICYDKSKKQVIFSETQHALYSPHLVDLWTDFTPLFGNYKNQIKTAMDKYGYQFFMSDDSYSKDGSDHYVITQNNYAERVGFVFNPDKQVSEFWVYLNKKAKPIDIIYYLEAKYINNEAESSKNNLVFYNKDKSVKIVLSINNAAVIYTKLSMKQHEAQDEILGDYHKAIGMTHDEIIAKYGTPFSDEDGSITYLIAGGYVNIAVFYLDSKTNKCLDCGLIVNENIKSSTFVEFLNSKYTVYEKGTLADGSKYKWINGATIAESSMGVTYFPTKKTILYQQIKNR